MTRNTLTACTLLLLCALGALPRLALADEVAAESAASADPLVDDATADELYQLAGDLIMARGQLEARISELSAAEKIDQEAAAELLAMIGSIDESIRPQINTLLGQPEGLPAGGGTTNSNYDSQYGEAAHSHSDSAPGYDSQYREATRSADAAVAGPAPLPGSASQADSLSERADDNSAVKLFYLRIMPDGSSDLNFEGFTPEEVGRVLEALSGDESAATSLPEDSSAFFDNGSAETEERGSADESTTLADSGPIDRVKSAAGLMLGDSLAEREIAGGLSAGIDLQNQRLHGSLSGEGPLSLRYSLAADGTAELEINAEDIDPAALGAQASSVSRSAAQRLENLAAKLERALRNLFD